MAAAGAQGGGGVLLVLMALLRPTRATAALWAPGLKQAGTHLTVMVYTAPAARLFVLQGGA